MTQVQEEKEENKEEQETETETKEQETETNDGNDMENIDNVPFSQIRKSLEENKPSIEVEEKLEERLKLIFVSMILYWTFSPLLISTIGTFSSTIAFLFVLLGWIFLYGAVGKVLYDKYKNSTYDLTNTGWKTETTYTNTSLDGNDASCVMCGKEHGDAIKHETKKTLYVLDQRVTSKDKVVTYDCINCADLTNISAIEKDKN